MQCQIRKLLPRLVAKEPPWHFEAPTVGVILICVKYPLVYHTPDMDLLVLPFACVEPRVLIHSANNVSKPHGSLLFGYFNGKWIPPGSCHLSVDKKKNSRSCHHVACSIWFDIWCEVIIYALMLPLCHCPHLCTDSRCHFSDFTGFAWYFKHHQHTRHRSFTPAN